MAHLQTCAQGRGIDLNTALRAAPSAPTDCCGRGCNGCLWESYFTALQRWRDEACALLATHATPQDVLSGCGSAAA
ncbi:oxidoreductase-like domain-containing protein [Rhodoferax sp.]|uniref:oxidoreductase-like domain-containing protein n=1 Tax=Rhodoferax sp. TaxID=50421 RepID=UPI00283FED55|nr:oxidoreductase-like domain-containing protein [Rhodoferax sp.]MDR3370652.1 oxidoreductase-like domain-containing protein [Rhodoferax sp.]